MFNALLLKEFRLILRDYYALAVLFIMPVLFVLIMSLSLKQVFASKETGQKEAVSSLKIYAAFDEKVSKAWRQDFAKIDSFEVKEVVNTSQGLEQAKQEVLAGKRFALITIPARLIRDLSHGNEVHTPIKIYYSPAAPGYVRQLLQAGLMKKLVEKKIAVTLAAGTRAAKQGETPQLDIHAFLGKSFISVEPLSTSAKLHTPSSVQQSVPAWLIFAMFFIVIPLSSTLLVELNNGTLERLNTYPIAKFWILLGKLVPYLGINLIQTLLMFLTGIFLVPLLGGDKIVLASNAWLLLPVSVCISLMAISFALLISVLVKTHEQASTVGGVSNLLMGAIGGVMVPVFVMPTIMQEVAKVSPMNWGLEAYLNILLRQGDFMMLLPDMLKLLALALVLFGLAYWKLNLRLQRQRG